MQGNEIDVSKLEPRHIGTAMETTTADGITHGFRLARYERSRTNDGEEWRLFSDGAPCRFTLLPGAILRLADSGNSLPATTRPGAAPVQRTHSRWTPPAGG